MITTSVKYSANHQLVLCDNGNKSIYHNIHTKEIIDNDIATINTCALVLLKMVTVENDQLHDDIVVGPVVDDTVVNLVVDELDDGDVLLLDSELRIVGKELNATEEDTCKDDKDDSVSVVNEAMEAVLSGQTINLSNSPQLLPLEKDKSSVWNFLISCMLGQICRKGQASLQGNVL